MTFRTIARCAGVLGALGAIALLIDPALAQDAATTAAPAAAPVAAAAPAIPVPNKGDTAFMYIASVLVLLMTVPGLALFYGGLVRTKNMLSMFMQVFATLCLVAIIWVLYGYSMAFTNGGGLNDFVGGFSKALLKGVEFDNASPHILERRLHTRIRLHRLPDDVRLHHAVPHPRRRRRALEVLVDAGVHGVVGDVHLLPDRPHGLVLGRPGCVRQCCESGRGRNRLCESAGPGCS